MRKNRVMWHVIITILFALFNVLSFLIPSDRTASFWISYCFTVIMFAIQYIIVFVISTNTKNIQKLFLFWPIVCVSITYFVIQIIVFFIFKIFSNGPVWVTITVFSLLLGVVLICMIAVWISIKTIEHLDEVQRK